MLKSLKVENFKSIVDKDICLKNLNVLTGLNGSGKSSILQMWHYLNNQLIIMKQEKNYFLFGNLLSLGNLKIFYRSIRLVIILNLISN